MRRVDVLELDPLWALPLIEPAPPVVDTPEDGDGLKPPRRGRWETRPVARRPHDCSDPQCRAIIGPGDPYYRLAVLEPSSDRSGYTVTVTKLCHATCAP